ncbi:MAG: DUF1343 domain-containing protein [Hyphomicrobiaceae bacterium]|nr:DUF1343 domain-containing protein [Hyphomicrobiaceae bacterium]
MSVPSLTQTHFSQRVTVGAEVLARSQFAALAGKRVGLITNQTGRVGTEHLADLLSRAPNLKLAAILAPEHGFRGQAEAGAAVRGGVDANTGVPIHSLYGASRRPTPPMLRDLDVLVFDIQDIGARFYTYISTMGLAMQAAAAARIPFVVLDRPNPLGGAYVSGFVLEAPLRSFVGEYPIPIVHGLTVGELARMIHGEKWLGGLDGLELNVVAIEGWQRAMRWPATERAWVATSPNIPSFEAALVYPGMGLVGEAEVNEGRGTPTPFCLFGAPWIEGPRLVRSLNQLGLPGVIFRSEGFTPRSIPGVAAHPRFVGVALSGVRIAVSDTARVEPLEVGMHVLAEIAAEARARGIAPLFPNLKMFHAVSGTRRLGDMLMAGSDGGSIIAAWQSEVEEFRSRRARYLLY